MKNNYLFRQSLKSTIDRGNQWLTVSYIPLSAPFGYLFLSIIALGERFGDWPKFGYLL
ncbi:MAG TPA: hypothetical protein VJ201_03010 [Candidatus Babeliales bacterium]|nr:hypothetical protein [Candidatus Babeliales bacterium]